MRFTDCDKWRDPWFMDLTLELKMLWIYLCDNCDNAGVWDVNHRLAEFQLGQRIDWQMAINVFEGRVTVLTGGKKWHLTKFLDFQYPAGLGSSNAHQQVRRLLTSHGLPYKERVGDGSMEASQKPPRLDQTRPSLSLDSSFGGGAEGVAPASALESNVERFTKFLNRLRLAHKPAEVQEWWSFAGELGAKGIAHREACIEAIVRKAREDGVKVRFVSHVESYGPQWKKWNEKQETERLSKESA